MGGDPPWTATRASRGCCSLVPASLVALWCLPQLGMHLPWQLPEICKIHSSESAWSVLLMNKCYTHSVQTDKWFTILYCGQVSKIVSLNLSEAGTFPRNFIRGTGLWHSTVTVIFYLYVHIVKFVCVVLIQRTNIKKSHELWNLLYNETWIYYLACYSEKLVEYKKVPLIWIKWLLIIY